MKHKHFLSNSFEGEFCWLDPTRGSGQGDNRDDSANAEVDKGNILNTVGDFWRSLFDWIEEAARVAFPIESAGETTG